MTRQTNADNLVDAIRNLGGTPKGGRPTSADLLDQLENLLGGGGGGVSPEQLRAAVDTALDDRLPTAIAEAIDTGGLDDGDFDDIFGGE